MDQLIKTALLDNCIRALTEIDACMSLIRDEITSLHPSESDSRDLLDSILKDIEIAQRQLRRVIVRL